MEGGYHYPAILLGQRAEQLQQREGTAAVQPRGGLLMDIKIHPSYNIHLYNTSHYTHTCTQAHTHTDTQMHTQMHTHRCTHTHTHTYTHTHTHTRTSSSRRAGFVSSSHPMFARFFSPRMLINMITWYIT